MWRIILFIGLMCSVALNVYLFMQLNVHAIESKIQQNVNMQIQPRVARIKNEKDNDVERAISTSHVQQIVNNIKSAVKVKDYLNASFLINSLANDHDVELAQVRLFWLHATEALIQQTLFSDAENAISAYLAFQPDDVSFLYQQVDLYWQQQLSLAAIKHAYDVQYHVFDEVKKRNAINFARELVQQHVDALINKGLWLELRGFG